MKKALLATVATTTLLFSTVAFASCQDNLTGLNQKTSSNENHFRVIVNGELGGDVRQLRNAARVFSANGMEDACEDTVASINELLEQCAEKMAENDQSSDGWFENEVERLKTAVPVGKINKPLRAAEVVGADIRNMKNVDLGEIDDVIVDPSNGEIAYVIMSHGGFLGLGEEQIAVPWQQLMVTSDTEDPVFVLNVSEKLLDEAPNFKRDSWAEIDKEDWRERNEIYFKENQS